MKLNVGNRDIRISADWNHMLIIQNGKVICQVLLENYEDGEPWSLRDVQIDRQMQWQREEHEAP